MYLLIVVLTFHSLQARGTTKFVVVDFYCTRYFSVLSRILKQLTDVAKIRDIFLQQLHMFDRRKRLRYALQRPGFQERQHHTMGRHSLD